MNVVHNIEHHDTTMYVLRQLQGRFTEYTFEIVVDNDKVAWHINCEYTGSRKLTTRMANIAAMLIPTFARASAAGFESGYHSCLTRHNYSF